MIKFKLPKIIFIIFSFFLFVPTLIFLPVPVFSQAASFPNATIHPQPVIRWGNTSYHDGVGARDPWVIRDGSTYYLYYDCTENLYNPSFESNLGTNGWDVWHATVSSSTEQKLFGDRSLKVVTDGTAHAGTYTGTYYYQNNPIPANAASGVGMAVFPGETYIASAYIWADSNTTMDFVVQQFKNNPGHFGENRLGDNYNFKQTIKGNNTWQRVSVKFTADIRTAAITISLASTNAQTTTSFWDGVQLERVTSSTNSTSDFPGNQEYFNRPIEELTGWRSCVATSTDGINFDKKGPVKVTGAKGDWENVERPGWTGTSFVYANVFPYQGKWYAYYWKGGGPRNFKDDSEAYLGLTLHLPAGLTISHPDRSGLAVADSPLGPFRRISQNNPVVDVVDPQGLCEGDIRPKEAAQGKVWGCEYLTANSVPQFIDNKWVLFLAGQTHYQKNTWVNSIGVKPGSQNCMVYGITAGIATSNSPLGPWTPSDINPIFNPAESCSTGENSLEGPVYYKDKSGKHVLFLNGISGGNGRVVAVWTDNPLAKWSLQNRKTVISKDQAPGGSGSAINLPTMVETPDGNTLNLYFGFRKSVPAGAESDKGGGDLHGMLFHDIGLATLPLPLNPPFTAAPVVSTPGVPAAAISGPSTGTPGQTFSFNSSITADSGIESSNIWIAKVTGSQGEAIKAGDIEGFDESKFNCGANRSFPNCIWYKIASGSDSSTSGQVKILTTGVYKVMIDVKPKEDNANQKLCSGNPYILSYPISTAGLTFYSCGLTSVLTVTVSSGNSGAATLTGYAIAESPADLPTDSSNRRVIQTTNSRINLTHNFPSSLARTTYTIFVRFFYSNGSYTNPPLQRSISFDPPTENTSGSTTTPVATTTTVTVTGYTLGEDLAAVQNSQAAEHPWDGKPINYTLTSEGTKTIFVKFFYSNNTSLVRQTSVTYHAPPAPAATLAPQNTPQHPPSPVVTTTGVPAATILGPSIGTAGQTFSFTSDINSDSGVEVTNMWIARVTGSQGEAIQAGDVEGFDESKFNCGSKRSFPNCIWYKIASGADKRTSGRVTISNPGTYQVIMDIKPQGANASQRLCSSNPYVSYPISTGGLKFYNCGPNSTLTITVSPAPTVTPTVAGVPAAFLSGPNVGLTGQILDFTAYINSPDGINSGTVYIAKVSSDKAIRVSGNDIEEYDSSKFNCDSNDSFPNCIWYKLGEGYTNNRFKATSVLKTPGQYVLIIDAQPGGSDSNQRRCSSNPYVTYPPTGLKTGGLTFYNCGPDSRLVVTIYQ